MTTTCTVCQAKYQLDAEKVPPRVVRVRCPACHGVFELDGSRVSSSATDEPLAVSRGYESAAAAPPPSSREPAGATPPPAPEPVAATPPPAPTVAAPAAACEIPAPRTGVAVMDEPAPAAPRRRRCKEEMLARALVSDIKVYNRELYETARTEGNLLEALGAEIKKSWELYKEKVTPEVANSTDHFRDALNEILAEGKNVF